LGTKANSKFGDIPSKIFNSRHQLKDIIKRYGEIDAFSQGKLKDNPLGDSSRNMGKNDLWIAATTSITNSKLITSDKDFNHLNGRYLDLILIEI
jgi:tRNA(fMet)-specific endonuclease VapC